MGLYNKVTKIKRSYYQTEVWQHIYNNRQVHQIGILYYLYRRDFSKRYSTDIYKKSGYKI